METTKTTVMLAALTLLSLLVRGGVEQNPGPAIDQAMDKLYSRTESRVSQAEGQITFQTMEEMQRPINSVMKQQQRQSRDITQSQKRSPDTTSGTHLRQKAGSILPDDHTHCNNEALHSNSVVYNAERSVRAENEHGNNRWIRFFNSNVGGLLPKLQIADFVEYINSFHLVCLTETYVSNELRANLFTEFCMFTSPAKQITKNKKNKKTHTKADAREESLR